jgi:hypothetical protein
VSRSNKQASRTPPTPARLEGCSLRVETPETRIANTQQKENIVQYGVFFIKKYRLGRENLVHLKTSDF